MRERVVDLPRGWLSVPLSSLGRWSGGGTPSKAQASFWKDGFLPWVSPKDMKVERIHDSEDHITEEAVRRSATKLIPSGSVLFVTRSGILAHTFPVAVTTVEVTVNQDLKAVTPHLGSERRLCSLGGQGTWRRDPSSVQQRRYDGCKH